MIETEIISIRLFGIVIIEVTNVPGIQEVRILGGLFVGRRELRVIPAPTPSPGGTSGP